MESNDTNRKLLKNIIAKFHEEGLATVISALIHQHSGNTVGKTYILGFWKISVFMYSSEALVECRLNPVDILAVYRFLVIIFWRESSSILGCWIFNSWISPVKISKYQWFSIRGIDKSSYDRGLRHGFCFIESDAFLHGEFYNRDRKLLLQ